MVSKDKITMNQQKTAKICDFRKYGKVTNICQKIDTEKNNRHYIAANNQKVKLNTPRW